MVMPELLPRLKLLVAVNVAPPENVMSLMPVHAVEADPDAVDSVATLPIVDEDSNI